MKTPRFLQIAVDSLGIQFPYKGDDLIWTWPWIRKKYKHPGKPYISLNCQGVFSTLTEVDEFWEAYFKTFDLEDSGFRSPQQSPH